jgi:hypothetical protein
MAKLLAAMARTLGRRFTGFNPVFDEVVPTICGKVSLEVFVLEESFVLDGFGLLIEPRVSPICCKHAAAVYASFNSLGFGLGFCKIHNNMDMECILNLWSKFVQVTDHKLLLYFP